MMMRFTYRANVKVLIGIKVREIHGNEEREHHGERSCESLQNVVCILDNYRHKQTSKSLIGKEEYLSNEH